MWLSGWLNFARHKILGRSVTASVHKPLKLIPALLIGISRMVLCARGNKLEAIRSRPGRIVTIGPDVEGKEEVASQ